jgi:hypothetical protein
MILDAADAGWQLRSRGPAARISSPEVSVPGLGDESDWSLPVISRRDADERLAGDDPGMCPVQIKRDPSPEPAALLIAESWTGMPLVITTTSGILASMALSICVFGVARRRKSKDGMERLFRSR